jgi:hypothetical protein
LERNNIFKRWNHTFKVLGWSTFEEEKETPQFFLNIDRSSQFQG